MYQLYFENTFILLKYYIFIMYLFAVIGFFAAFLAFMKFGSNDFGISTGKKQPKGPKTF